METRVCRLREIINLVQPVIPKKPALAVLAYVLLQDGKAVGSDYETMVVIDYPEAEEAILLPHAHIKDFLRYVPGDSVITVTQEDKTVKFVWEDGKATFQSDFPKEYPPLPEVKDAVSGFIDGDRLMPALESVVGYCSTEGTRPVLAGVSLTVNENVELAAGDGFRLAFQILPIPFHAEAKTIIPAHSVRVLAKLWDKLPPPVPMAGGLIEQVMSKRQIELVIGTGLSFRFGRINAMIKIIEGSAPVYSQLIPKEPPLMVRVFAPDLDRAVRRCAGVAKDDKGIVRLKWNEDTLTVAAISGDGDSIEANVKIQAEGGEGKVAVNTKYLVEYLGGKDGLVTMHVKDEKSPVLFRYSSAPQVLIMPMFVDWEGKAKTEPEPEPEEEAEGEPEPEPKPEAEPEPQPKAKAKAKTQGKAK